jgi:hypothetical protein
MHSLGLTSGLLFSLDAKLDGDSAPPHFACILYSYYTELTTWLQALMRDLMTQKKISKEAFRRFYTDFGPLEGRESIYRVREPGCAFDTLKAYKTTRIKTRSEGSDGAEVLLAPKSKESTAFEMASANLDTSSSNGAIPDFLSIVVSYTEYPHNIGCLLTKAAGDAILSSPNSRPNSPLAKLQEAKRSIYGFMGALSQRVPRNVWGIHVAYFGRVLQSGFD